VFLAASIDWEPTRDSVLTLLLAGFAIAVLLARVAPGFASKGLVRVKAAALPFRTAARQISLIIACTLLVVLLAVETNATSFPASRFANEDSWILSDTYGLTPLLAMLAVVGAAIVVVLSDFAEAQCFQSDMILRKTRTDCEICDLLWGYGTSVMGPRQNCVLLAMRAFVRARLAVTPAVRAWLVALKDFKPALQDFGIGQAPKVADGISLLPFLAGHENPAIIDSRVRFTEASFNTLKLMKGKIRPSGLVSEGVIY